MTDFSEGDKAVIGKIVADGIAIKAVLNSMLSQLSCIEEDHEDDPDVQYRIGRAIGQLDMVYHSLTHFEI